MNKSISAVALLLGTLAFSAHLLCSQMLSVVRGPVDSDGDGLSDELEGDLLARFAPTFMIGREDCSIRPAQFFPENKSPTVLADDGTIYGQVFPRKGRSADLELHYYHLWRRDCGESGHHLDAEHVSVLVHLGDKVTDSKAIYWYAAAHEDTICNASHLTRAETIRAEDHGATVWISEGKHASFLSEALCTHGCGGDCCEQMEALMTKQIVNVGEMGRPMNGIFWLASPEWPLSDKLRRTDFTELRITRLEKLPATDISWANPSKRPAQAAIMGANAGLGGAATGARATNTALVVTNSNTASALGAAADDTSNALKKSSRNVWKALKKSARKTSKMIDGNPQE